MPYVGFVFFKRSMLSFFGLSFDLQIHVIQTWLGGNDRNLLKALSRLDVACTSKSQRPHFMSLARLPSSVWSNCIESTWICGQYILSYLRWLHSREVRLRWLVLGVVRGEIPAGLRLPFVEYLQIDCIKIPRDLGKDMTVTVRNILTACSSLLSFVSTYQPLGGKEMWAALTHCTQHNLLRLKRLRSSTQMVDTITYEGLSLLGGWLEHLDISWSRFDEPNELAQVFLSGHWPLLKVLHLNGSLPADVVLEIVSGCPQLTELGLLTEKFEGTHQEVMQILETVTMLKTFTVDSSIGFTLFVEILQRFPLLTNVKVSDIWYSSSSRTLSLFDREQFGTPWSIEGLEAIFNSIQVHYTTSLKLQLQEGDERALQLIGSALGANLTDLSITTYFLSRVNKDSEPIVTLFSHCCSLKRLVLQCVAPVIVDEADWPKLSAFCRHLQYLQLVGVHPQGTDDAIIQVWLTHCPCLKEVELLHRPGCSGITARSLQFIVDQRLPLEKLSVRNPGFGQADVDNVRRLAKERQLLPVFGVTFVMD